MQCPVQAMVSVKHRAMIFGVVVLATILVGAFWEGPPGHESSGIPPEPNWIGSTWYGPALLISIPICLAWLSWGVRNEFIKGLGLVLSMLVAGASAFLIVVGREGATGWMSL
jgi:hypothetical protein